MQGCCLQPADEKAKGGGENSFLPIFILQRKSHQRQLRCGGSGSGSKKRPCYVVMGDERKKEGERGKRDEIFPSGKKGPIASQRGCFHRIGVAT